jgi:hypothetical protein
MRLYVEGEKSKAICDRDGLVSTTFSYQDVPFEDGSGVVPSILVAVCDGCGEVVATPPQSTPAIKLARAKATVPVEAQLPPVYVEALDLAAFRIDPDLSADFRKRLFSYYVHELSKAELGVGRLREGIASFEGAYPDAVKLKIRKRLSMKVSPALSNDMEALMRAASLSKTGLIKSVVGIIHKDVIEPDRPARLQELKRLAAMMA